MLNEIHEKQVTLFWSNRTQNPSKPPLYCELQAEIEGMATEYTVESFS